jgi:hypothetical protein
MQQLLCEPEDRLGSQSIVSVSRPDSIVVQARRSGFILPTGNSDGACLIKVRLSPCYDLISEFSHAHRLTRSLRASIG